MAADNGTESNGKKTIFVTVGTTQFDELVQAVVSDLALKWMESEGYTHLLIQYGAGDEPPVPSSPETSKITISTYRFRPNLLEDMKKSDLIISHAGAGTVMEVMGIRGKPLVVVINTRLMDNHQTELAEAMAERRHLYMVESAERLNIAETWESFARFVPVPHQGGDENQFANLLNRHLGFKSKTS